MTIADPMTDIFTILEGEIEEPVVCESDHCETVLHKPAHDAEYLARFTACCNWSYLVCRERVEMFKNQRVVCNCGATVPGTSIRSGPL